MTIRRTVSAIILAALLAAAGPADAAPPGSADGWRGWFARTVAEALRAIGGSDREPDFEAGGELLLDRGMTTVSHGLQRTVPRLGRLDGSLRFDERGGSAYGLGLTQPLALRGGAAFNVEGSLGHQPEGHVRQMVALTYRHSAARPGMAPRRFGLKLERDAPGGEGHARHAVAGEIGWAGLELGGGLRTDGAAAGQPARAQPPRGQPAGGVRLEGAEARLIATLPGVAWAELETRGRWSTSPAEPARLVVSEAVYLVRARPLGPLELTAGRRVAGRLDADWFTRLQLKVELGGST